MNRKKYPVVNIGTTSLLTIFVILCMVTFAALSWLTAVRNARLNERVQERTEAWYQAANAAYEKIAEIDETLQEYRADGRWEQAPPEYSFSIPIDENSKLRVRPTTHAPDSETRSRIMPINRAYDVEELFAACHDYFDKTGRRISFEYAMIDGVNDHDWQADLIAKKLRGMPGHVNLIPLNDVVESPYKPSRRIGAFQKRLESHGVTATVRRSLGGDIDASCGQLRRKAMEEAQKGECSQ